jgi:hypothetical protein
LNIAWGSSCKTANNLESIHQFLTILLLFTTILKLQETYHGLSNTLTTLHQRTNFLGNTIDGLEVANGGNGETSFQNINTQLGQLCGNCNLFIVIQTDAGRLK